MVFRVAGGVAANQGGPLGYYGLFIRTSNQTNPVASAANMVGFDTTVRSSGITNNAGVITFANPGIYQVISDLAWSSTTGTNPVISAWLYQNGANVANTNQDFQLLAGANTVQFASCVWIISAAANDTFSVYWSVANTNVLLAYQGPASTPTRPASPSAILSITQV